MMARVSVLLFAIFAHVFSVSAFTVFTDFTGTPAQLNLATSVTVSGAPEPRLNGVYVRTWTSTGNLFNADFPYFHKEGTDRFYGAYLACWWDQSRYQITTETGSKYMALDDDSPLGTWGHYSYGGYRGNPHRPDSPIAGLTLTPNPQPLTLAGDWAATKSVMWMLDSEQGRDCDAVCSTVAATCNEAHLTQLLFLETFGAFGTSSENSLRGTATFRGYDNAVQRLFPDGCDYRDYGLNSNSRAPGTTAPPGFRRCESGTTTTTTCDELGSPKMSNGVCEAGRLSASCGGGMGLRGANSKRLCPCEFDTRPPVITRASLMTSAEMGHYIDSSDLRSHVKCMPGTYNEYSRSTRSCTPCASTSTLYDTTSTLYRYSGASTGWNSAIFSFGHLGDGINGALSVGFTPVVDYSSPAISSNSARGNFNAKFHLSPNKILKHLCLNCNPSMREVYYKYIGANPSTFDAHGTLTNWAWKNNAHQLNVHFRLYSSYENAMLDRDRWEWCSDQSMAPFPHGCVPRLSVCPLLHSSATFMSIATANEACRRVCFDPNPRNRDNCDSDYGACRPEDVRACMSALGLTPSVTYSNRPDRTVQIGENSVGQLAIPSQWAWYAETGPSVADTAQPTTRFNTERTSTVLPPSVCVALGDYVEPEWVLADVVDAGQSCDVVCSQRQAKCDQDAIDDLSLDPMSQELSNHNLKAKFAAAGHTVRSVRIDCSARSNCVRWGSPYVHKSHIHESVGWGGNDPSLAPCGQFPADRHHMRLCPCQTATRCTPKRPGSIVYYPTERFYAINFDRLGSQNSGCKDGSHEREFVAGSVVGCTGKWTMPGMDAGGRALCAEGWEICPSERELRRRGVSRLGNTGCNTCSRSNNAPEFFGTKQASFGSCEVLRPQARGQWSSSADPCECEDNPAATNGVYGCGCFNGYIGSFRFENTDKCGVMGTRIKPSYQSSEDQSRVYHSTQDAVGVMCCRRASSTTGGSNSDSLRFDGDQAVLLDLSDPSTTNNNRGTSPFAQPDASRGLTIELYLKLPTNPEDLTAMSGSTIFDWSNWNGMVATDAFEMRLSSPHSAGVHSDTGFASAGETQTMGGAKGTTDLEFNHWTTSSGIRNSVVESVRSNNFTHLTLSPGTWHHVVAAVAPSGRMDLFVDDTLVASETPSSAHFTTTTRDTFFIGRPRPLDWAIARSSNRQLSERTHLSGKGFRGELKWIVVYNHYSVPWYVPLFGSMPDYRGRLDIGFLAGQTRLACQPCPGGHWNNRTGAAGRVGCNEECGIGFVCSSGSPRRQVSSGLCSSSSLYSSEAMLRMLYGSGLSYTSPRTYDANAATRDGEGPCGRLVLGRRSLASAGGTFTPVSGMGLRRSVPRGSVAEETFELDNVGGLPIVWWVDVNSLPPWVRVLTSAPQSNYDTTLAESDMGSGFSSGNVEALFEWSERNPSASANGIPNSRGPWWEPTSELSRNPLFLPPNMSVPVEENHEIKLLLDAAISDSNTWANGTVRILYRQVYDTPTYSSYLSRPYVWGSQYGNTGFYDGEVSLNVAIRPFELVLLAFPERTSLSLSKGENATRSISLYTLKTNSNIQWFASSTETSSNTINPTWITLDVTEGTLMGLQSAIDQGTPQQTQATIGVDIATASLNSIEPREVAIDIYRRGTTNEDCLSPSSTCEIVMTSYITITLIPGDVDAASCRANQAWRPLRGGLSSVAINSRAPLIVETFDVNGFRSTSGLLAAGPFMLGWSLVSSRADGNATCPANTVCRGVESVVLGNANGVISYRADLSERFPMQGNYTINLTTPAGTHVDGSPFVVAALPEVCSATNTRPTPITGRGCVCNVGLGRVGGSASGACAPCPLGFTPPTCNAPSDIGCNAPCIACEAGFRGIVGTTIRCVACSNGTVSLAGASTCTECPVGKYHDYAAKVCLPCTPGTANALTHQVSCERCEAGRHAPGFGTVECVDCAAGRASVEARDRCDDCEAGNSSRAADAACTPCAPGHVSAGGVEFCTICPAGRIPNELSSSCVLCAVGKVALLPGQRCCNHCKRPGFNSSEDCAPDRATESVLHEPSQSRDTCIPCRPNQIINVYNQRQCENCNHSNQVVLNEQCVCAPGYNTMPDGSCSSCDGYAGHFCFRSTSEQRLPLKGYWQVPWDKTVITPCRNKEACRGMNFSTNTVQAEALTDEDIAVHRTDLATNPCAAGYKGTLCFECDAGYTRSGRDKCRECFDQNAQIIITIFAVVFGALCVMFLIYKTIQNANQAKTDEIQIMKILASQMQLVAIAANFPLDWPDWMEAMFSIFDFASSAGETALRIDCMAQEVNEEDGPGSFVVSAALVSVLPIINLFISAVFWGSLGVWRRCNRDESFFAPTPDLADDDDHDHLHDESQGETAEAALPASFTTTNSAAEANNEQITIEMTETRRARLASLGEDEPIDDAASALPPRPKSITRSSNKRNIHRLSRSPSARVLRSFRRIYRKHHHFQAFIISNIVLLFLLHPTLSKMSFKFFTCSTEDLAGRSFLEANPSYFCWGSDHLAWALPLGVFMVLIYTAGIPLLAWLIMSRVKQYDPTLVKFRPVFGFLYNGYRHKYYYWECCIMARKVAFAFVAVVLNRAGVDLQAYTGLIVVSIAILAQVHCRPYADNNHNRLEVLGLSCALITLFAGLYLFSENTNIFIRYLCSITVIVVNVMFFSYMFALLRSSFLRYYRMLCGICYPTAEDAAAKRAAEAAEDASVDGASSIHGGGISIVSYPGYKMAIDAKGKPVFVQDPDYHPDAPRPTISVEGVPGFIKVTGPDGNAVWVKDESPRHLATT